MILCLRSNFYVIKVYLLEINFNLDHKSDGWKKNFELDFTHQTHSGLLRMLLVNLKSN